MNQKSKLIKYGYYLLALTVVGFALYFYQAVFSYFIISLFFCFLFNPLIVMIENIGVKRVYAILIFYVIFFSNLVLIGNILVPTIVRQLHSLGVTYSDFVNLSDADFQHLPLIVRLDAFWENVQSLFPFVDFEAMEQNVIDWSNRLLSNLPGFIISYSSNVFRLFSYLFSVPIISFFLLKDHIFLRNKIYSMIPNKYFEITLIIFDKLNNTVGKYLRALFTETSIIATLNCIILSILGVRFGIIVGILGGLFNVIPYLGPAIGIVLGALTVIFTGGSSSLLVSTILGMYCVQIIDNAVVYPLVMGRNTNLHPVIIILTVIAGGFAFGLLGMLAAVPTVFLTITFLRVLYKNLKEFEII